MQETKQLIGELEDLQQELNKLQGEKEELTLELAELSKEMNQFAYIVSHELQASLRMVTGFLELLNKKYGDQLDESARTYIDFAVKGAVKMKNLVSDLLDYSRLNTVTGEIEKVDLNRVWQEVQEQFRPLAESTSAVITADPLPSVRASKKQMGQLFHHLLSNALKFCSTAAPEIGITLTRENDYWMFAVKDNGIGIDPAFAEKIFAVFRKLHSDESKFGGTGIGLAMCRKIITLHSGRIWVESAAGKGSTFFFTLPADTE